MYTYVYMYIYTHTHIYILNFTQVQKFMNEHLALGLAIVYENIIRFMYDK